MKATQISGSIGWKEKLAVSHLIRKGYYASESDFIKKAVANQLNMDNRDRKFNWEDLKPEDSIRVNKK